MGSNPLREAEWTRQAGNAEIKKVKVINTEMKKELGQWVIANGLIQTVKIDMMTGKIYDYNRILETFSWENIAFLLDFVQITFPTIIP